MRQSSVSGTPPASAPNSSVALARSRAGVLVLILAASLFGCSEADDDDGSQNPAPGAGAPQQDGSTSGPTASAGSDQFSLAASESRLSLQEGADEGTSIALTLERSAGFSAPVELSVDTAASGGGLNASLSDTTLETSESDSELTLALAVDTLPRQRELLDLVITATSGAESASTTVQIEVEPVQAPDVYLLIGQSNMVGFSGDRTRMAGVGEPDAPDPRILQLQVSSNNSEMVFATPRDYVSDAANIVVANPLIEALDPLHEPLGEDGNGKVDAYIGPGLSFAKAALANTTQSIVLVPAAWSSTQFCLDDPLPPNGQLGGWNAIEPTSPELGNTLLFDRALTRVNAALEISGGILRGILWHQGETDANERCAPLYEQNLRTLVSEIRSRIDVDPAGAAFRGPDAPVPFIIGTMSRGADERGDLSVFPPEKQRIDDAHRLLAAELPFAGLANLDDLVPPQYPCGNTTCIHFGPGAQRVAGARFYEALQGSVEP